MKLDKIDKILIPTYVICVPVILWGCVLIVMQIIAGNKDFNSSLGLDLVIIGGVVMAIMNEIALGINAADKRKQKEYEEQEKKWGGL